MVGIDAGGSHTRALLARIDGQPLALGRAGGGNPISHGLEHAVANLQRALSDALGGVNPTRVRYIVLAVAGDSPDPAFAALDDLGRSAGLACPCQRVSDLEAAFAAGTHEQHGIVLLSGTGAAVGAVRDNRLVRWVDGYGWLLGDDGSGFWLGREAIRAALAALDGRGPATCLVDTVSAAFGTAPTVSGLVSAGYRQEPIKLAALAPLVTEAAAAGDAVAAVIIRRAADALLAATRALGPDRERHPIRAVLAGGVLAAPGPLAEAIRAGLRAEYGLSAVTARDGAAGAASLAWCALTGQAMAPEVHARLTK